MKVIYCPGPEKWIPLREYLRAVRLAKANLDRTFRHGLTQWWPCTGREIVAQFLRGVHDRINERIPYTQRVYLTKENNNGIHEKKR